MVFESCLLFLSVGAAPLLASLLVLLLGTAVYLFLVTRVELRLLSRRSVIRAELETAVRQLTGELEELRGRLNEAERERQSPSVEPESLNLNRRAQVLGLHRKGKRVQEIASVLRIPQGEVELMVKVHDLSQSASREINAQSIL